MTKFTWTIPPRVHVNVVTVQERIADSFGEIFFRGKFFFFLVGLIIMYIVLFLLAKNYQLVSGKGQGESSVLTDIFTRKGRG